MFAGDLIEYQFFMRCVIMIRLTVVVKIINTCNVNVCVVQAQVNAVVELSATHKVLADPENTLMKLLIVSR